MKVKLSIILFFITANLFAQSNNSFMFSQSAANSVSVEFKTSKMKSDIFYGAGVSFFYNKGNKGKDYTGFAGIDPIGFVNDSYENVLSKSGSIFFIIGNKINKNLFCNFCLDLICNTTLVIFPYLVGGIILTNTILGSDLTLTIKRIKNAKTHIVSQR